MITPINSDSWDCTSRILRSWWITYAANSLKVLQTTISFIFSIAMRCIKAICDVIRPDEAVLSSKGIIKYKWSSRIVISKEGSLFIAS
jgi:hypothetical protein